MFKDYDVPPEVETMTNNGHSVTFTQQAGISPRNVVAKKIAKKMIELKGDCELTFLGDQESQVVCD